LHDFFDKIGLFPYYFANYAMQKTCFITYFPSQKGQKHAEEHKKRCAAAHLSFVYCTLQIKPIDSSIAIFSLQNGKISTKSSE